MQVESPPLNDDFLLGHNRALNERLTESISITWSSEAPFSYDANAVVNKTTIYDFNLQICMYVAKFALVIIQDKACFPENSHSSSSELAVPPSKQAKFYLLSVPQRNYNFSAKVSNFAS